MNGIWIISIVVMAISLGISQAMNENLQKMNPTAKSYMWGYFLGLSNPIIWILLSIFAVVSGTGDGLAVGVFCVIMAFISIGYIFRNRWWAVAATVIQFNPIVWVINAIYFRNRWTELKGLDTSFRSKTNNSLDSPAQHSDKNQIKSPETDCLSEEDLTFKDNNAAFELCCGYMVTEIKVGNGIAAIVLDAKEYLGAKRSVPINKDGYQQAYIKVASDDGGFKTVADAYSKNGPKLNAGDLVMWVPVKFVSKIASKFKDPRIGWGGYIAARLKPTFSATKGWKIDETFK